MFKPQIIILEGCDKTGKTTLAKEMCKRLNLKYVKVSNPNGDPYDEYINLILSVKEPTLFDRFHLGELVYGKHVRGKSGLDDKKFNNVEALLRQHNALIVYAHNTINFIKQKFIDDNETFLKQSDIKPILSLYSMALQKTTLPVIKYKINGNDYKWIKQKIKINNEKRVCHKTRVVGAMNPKVLIVGDVNNINKKRYKQLPFDFGPSSNFLFKNIPDRKLMITAITNSTKAHLSNVNQEKLFKDELSELSPNVVVFLGKQAARLAYLVDKDKTIFFLPHPQYVARFMRYNNNYSNLLKRAYKN